MIEVCSLSSGSNGNAIFVKTGGNAFLVDAGISCRQICLRLEQIQEDMNDIKGIFITHEHSDHVKGLSVFLKRFPMPVYVTEKTYKRINISIDASYLHFINSNDLITIDETTIQSLPKYHDAVEPTLFCFYYKNKKISIVTDVGKACEKVIEAVRDAHIVFLESNYDENMLWEGFYPFYLKKRIAGDFGHLSNAHAGSLILDHASPHLEYVFLSHLSENNNTPEMALNTFQSIIKERDDLSRVNTILTSRHGVSPRIRLSADR